MLCHFAAHNQTLHSTGSAGCDRRTLWFVCEQSLRLRPASREKRKAANLTQLNTSTHLVMSLAEEKRDERQTFELEAIKSEKQKTG